MPDPDREHRGHGLRSRETLAIASVVAAALALAAFSIHDPRAGLVTRGVSALVAMALLVQACATFVHGYRCWRAHAPWQALLWMSGALLQSLLAVLALTVAFPVEA